MEKYPTTWLQEFNRIFTARRLGLIIGFLISVLLLEAMSKFG
jgi:hypothetical protein